MKRKPWLFGVLYTSTMLLTACSPLLLPTAHYPPAPPVNIPPPPKTNGTIFQPGYESRLFPDQVAFRIGDSLTVRLDENRSGTYKSRTFADKRANLVYPIPTFFGNSIDKLKIDTETQQLFNGTGNSDQSNKLTGTITVTVIELLPNRNLLVQGESWVSVNQGQEFVQLRGIVRPEDIRPDNTISSQRVANANINYGARGQAGYATHGGLLTKLFNRFFPY